MSKATPALLVTIALLNLTACGGSDKGRESAAKPSSAADAGAVAAGPATRAGSVGSYFKNDGDHDTDDDRSYGKEAPDDARAVLAEYGSEAGQADERAIAALVKSYYAAAAAGDGAKACSLLTRSLAATLAESSGRSAGKGCAAPLSRLFEQQHTHLLADDVATMVVTAVHIKGNAGLAVLGFRRAPEGSTIVEREGGAWRINALLDNEMP
jgi:hypothetical protein